MADFKKRVKIEVDLEAEVGDAVSKLTGAFADIRGSAELIESDLADAEDALESFSKKSDEQDINLEVSAEPDPQEISQAVLSGALFGQTVAAANPIQIPLGVDPELGAIEALGEEINMVGEAEGEMQSLFNAKSRVADANATLGEEAEKSSDSLGIETRGVKELYNALEGDGTSSLEAAKYAAKNANEVMSESAEESARFLNKETDSGVEARDMFDGLEDTKRKTANASDEVGDALRRARRSTDEMTDSMRASQQVGELFEEGLGNLSLNVGAFTIALRNFLTQVPAIMTALSGIGATAAGAASAVAALGGAMLTAFGAGVVARAQEIKEENENIQQTTAALQGILNDLKKTFAEAFAPLLENRDIVNVFKESISGLATVARGLATSVDSLMDASGRLDAVNQDTGESALSLQGVMDEIATRTGPQLEELFAALENTFIQLQDEFIHGIEMMVGGLADLIDRSTHLVDEIESLSETASHLSDTISEMAELGINVFGGIQPVVLALTDVMRGFAETLNRVNDEVLENAVTFLVITAGINKFGGIIGSIISVIPSFITKLAVISGTVESTDQSVNSLRRSIGLVGSELGQFIAETPGFLSGFTALEQSVSNFDRSMRAAILSTDAGEDAIDDLKKEMLEAGDGADEFEGDVEELEDDLRSLAITGELTEESLEDINGVTPKRASVGASSGAIARLSGSMGVLGAESATASTGVGSLTGALGSLSAVLTGPVLLAIGILIVAIGALTVGILTNMEDVKKGIAVAFDVVMGILHAVVDWLLTVFIQTWNLIVDIVSSVYLAFKPLIDSLMKTAEALGLVNSASDETSAIMQFLKLNLKATKVFIRAVSAGLGGLFRILGLIINLTLKFGKAFWGILDIPIISWLKDLAKWLGLSGDEGDSLIDKFTDLSDSVFGFGETVMQTIEDVVNAAIENFNKLAKSTPFLDTVDKVNLDVGEGAKASREDLTESTDELRAREPRESPTVSYMEDNSTQINQDVQADPEDKAQLSRTVKDAIEEANSFERRQMGGQ